MRRYSSSGWQQTAAREANAKPPSSNADADGSAYGQLRRSGALTNGQPAERYDGGPEKGTADVTPAQPRVTQQQAFPGLARQAQNAHSDVPPSQAGTKDYSKNGATGDYAHGPLP